MRENRFLEIGFFTGSSISCRTSPRTTFVISQVVCSLYRNLLGIIIDLYWEYFYSYLRVIFTQGKNYGYKKNL